MDDIGYILGYGIVFVFCCIVVIVGSIIKLIKWRKK